MQPSSTANRLGQEKSPYLLQHASNPVDWYPWGPEAFERARREDRPVFLSIGYSTCHWCHVMAHESFENAEVAALMNETFINIKVDREERPDIDGIYMTVCQMMTGGGGWPLTILMTPDKRPFFAGTYIPRTTRFGRIGMLDFVPRIRELWTTRREELLQAAEQVTDALLREGQHKGRSEELDAATLDLAFRQLHRSFDVRHGGFGQAPKFPTPHNLLFLLRYHQRTGDEDALRMVELTLRRMRRGGICDQLGFGFHRYSTDEVWLVPHFEKMLYDQALLALAYLEAHQVSGAEDHARAAREIFTYVERELAAPEGAFYSAEDADSEGREGKFYLWTAEEIAQTLDEEQAELAQELFDIRPEGNFRDEASGQRTGANILHLRRSQPDLARDLGLEPEELERRAETMRLQLLERRARRPRPALDDKVLADWNGLMVAALARGARVLGEQRYATAAARAASFVLQHMRGADGALLHRYRDGEAAIPGQLDDYAFMVWGLCELYEATFEPRHLEQAVALNSQMIERLWDEERGGLFAAPDNPEDLLVRQKSVLDSAVPSGNSVALLNLLRLGRITADPELEQRADQLARAFSRRIASGPAAFTYFLVGLDFAIGPTHEVVVAGPRNDETQALLTGLQRAHLPNTVLLHRRTDAESAITCVAPFTADQQELEGRPAIYVCQDFHCHRPTTDLDQALELLRGA